MECEDESFMQWTVRAECRYYGLGGMEVYAIECEKHFFQ
jgi:hypothetical protein